MNHAPDSRRPGSRTSDLAPAAVLVRDRAWAEAATTGDRAAFAAIYEAYRNRIYGLCLRLTGDVPEAEQLVQDTFVRAWFSIGGYRGDGNLGGWLGRTATNLWRDRFRSAARRRQLERDLAETLAADAPAQGPDGGNVTPLLTAVDLERAIARLPRGARIVYVCFELEGYSHREIAALLDVAVGTVKAQLHRARQLLRGMLADPKEDRR